jgi:glycosyltransferase involved in cell wall biosynthesis
VEPGGVRASIRVVHLTSVHPAHDTRILVKECQTLAQHGYEVVLVAIGDRSEIRYGVRIHAIARSRSRLARITLTQWRVYQAAKKLDGDVYHFHDPELLFLGCLLRALGKTVIYDVHEDIEGQTLSREWIPARARRAAARLVNVIERIAVRPLNLVVAATPTIAKRFPSVRTVTVQNFPILGELRIDEPVPLPERERLVVYVGIISRIRGAFEMVDAMATLPADSSCRLVLAGQISPPGLLRELALRPGWQRTEFVGWQSRQEVRALLNRARVGLIIMHPVPNYLPAQPNKLYEYMSVGLPFIASDFPLWREAIGDGKCGLLVDPHNASAIGSAIMHIVDNPSEGSLMGLRGIALAEERFDWAIEARKLLEAYADLPGVVRRTK